MSPNQCCAARLNGHNRATLVPGSGLSTIHRYENETRWPRQTAILGLQGGLELAGVELFFDDNDLGVGIRLRKNRIYLISRQ